MFRLVEPVNFEYLALTSGQSLCRPSALLWSCGVLMQVPITVSMEEATHDDEISSSHSWHYRKGDFWGLCSCMTGVALCLWQGKSERNYFKIALGVLLA